MEIYKREKLTVLMVATFAGAAILAACAPTSSDNKAESDGRLNQAEIAVWVQSTSDEAGKYRVLFGVDQKADAMELCKIPADGLPDNFVCDATKQGYFKLTALTNNDSRKIFLADKLPIAHRDGYAVYAKQGSDLLYKRPREAYFGKKVPDAQDEQPIQFSQVKAIMDQTCSGSTCHDNGANNGLFMTGEAAFATAKNALTARISNGSMPKAPKSFVGDDKQIMLNYLNKLP